MPYSYDILSLAFGKEFFRMAPVYGQFSDRNQHGLV